MAWRRRRPRSFIGLRGWRKAATRTLTGIARTLSFLAQEWSGWEPDLAWCSAVEPWWSSWLHQSVLHVSSPQAGCVGIEGRGRTLTVKSRHWHWVTVHVYCCELVRCMTPLPQDVSHHSLTHQIIRSKNKACLDLGVLVLVLVTSSNLLLVRLRVYSIFCWIQSHWTRHWFNSLSH